MMKSQNITVTQKIANGRCYLSNIFRNRISENYLLHLQQLYPTLGMRLWTFSTCNPQERNKTCSFIWQALNLNVYSLCILHRYLWKCTIGQGLPLWEQCVTIPKNLDTNSDIFFYSKFFRYWIQNHPKNGKVSKPRSFETEMSHSASI